MGGASTQITFQALDILADYFETRFSNRVVRLYTHSYLYFGLNEAIGQLEENLVAAAVGPVPPPTPLIVANPCFAFDYTTNYTSSSGISVFFYGTSDVNSCSGNVSLLLNKQAKCFFGDDCAVAGEYQPPVAGNQFIAFSGFAKILKLMGLSPNSTIGQIGGLARATCNLTYTQLMLKYPPSDFLYAYCFDAMYFYALLHEGYGFDEESNSIAMTKTIGDYSVGWALGAMMYEANLLPWSLPQCQSQSGISTTAVIAVSVCLVVVIVFLAVALVVVSGRYQKMAKHQSLLMDSTMFSSDNM